MFTYIKNDIASNLITLNEELDSNSYPIGVSYEDYLDGKWVKLSEEQKNFADKNQTATIKEIWDMQLAPSDLTKLKNQKILEITEYDKSSDVNSFTLNGYNAWVDRETRVSLMTTTQIKKQMGEYETTIWFDNYSFTMPCDTVIQMLSQLEMYAYDCFNQTAKHKAAVLELDDEEQIKNYDYKVGYPEKLSFDTLNL